MNKSNAARFLPLVQALADGKTIQINSGTSSEPDWGDVESPIFGNKPETYRVKPEPKELFVNEYAEHSVAHSDEMSARLRAGPTARRVSVRYREVIE